MSRLEIEVKHIPSFEEYTIPSIELRDKLQVIKFKQLYLWDNHYYYISHEDWGKVFADVLLNQPKYTAEKFDCENSAMLTSARVSSRYKLNTCGIVVGNSPYGRHGFCIFLSDQGLYYLEPQNSMVYSIDEDSGYKAEIIILG